MRGRVLPAAGAGAGRSVCAGPPPPDPAARRGAGDAPREGFASRGLFSVGPELEDADGEGETPGAAGGPGAGEARGLRLRNRAPRGVFPTF